MTYAERKDFIEKYQAFIESLVLPMNIGDMVVFNATTWHGVLPVSFGTRHTLIMNLANKNPVDGRKTDCDWRVDFPMHGDIVDTSNTTAYEPRIDLFVDWVEKLYGPLANRYA